MVVTSPYGRILRKKKGETEKQLAKRQTAEFKKALKKKSKKKKK